MVKDGENWHRLQTKLKNLGWVFETVQPWLCALNEEMIEI